MYKKQKVDKHWNNLCKMCFKRDKSTCYRCGKHERKMTIHHINPRPKGPDELDNLITLCLRCHDFVEERAYTTLFEIKNSGWDLQNFQDRQAVSDAIGEDVVAIEITKYDPTIYDKQIAGLAVRKVYKDWWGSVYGGQRLRRANDLLEAENG